MASAICCGWMSALPSRSAIVRATLQHAVIAPRRHSRGCQTPAASAAVHALRPARSSCAQLRRLHQWHCMRAGRAREALAFWMARAASTRFLIYGRRLRHGFVRLSSSNCTARHLYDDVDAVEHRAGDARTDTGLHRRLRAGAPSRLGRRTSRSLQGFIAQTSMKFGSGTCIEPCTREMVTVPVLERLAQHLERLAVEFRQLIEEQHAACAPARLRPGRGVDPPPASAVAGRGVVRRAERPSCCTQRPLRRQEAHHGVDLRDLQRLLARHIRQDGRQAAWPACSCRSPAGRSSSTLCAACGRDLQRALRHSPAPSRPLKSGRRCRPSPQAARQAPARWNISPAQMGGQLPHLLHADRRSGRPPAWPPRAFSAGTYSVLDAEPSGRPCAMGSTPLHRPQLAFEAQLAEEGARPSAADGQAPAPRECRAGSAGHRACRSFSCPAGARFSVMRLTGKRKPQFLIAARTRSRDSLHGGVRQADELKARQAAGDAALDHYRIAADAGQAHGIHA